MAHATEKAQTDKRSRNWVGILYAGSLPKNWQAQLDGLQYALSPWHDKDVDDDGKIKKKHRHIYLKFPNVKSFSQVKAIFDALNQPHPQICQNPVGAIRYFCHLDNPEKAQYALADCIDHGIGVAKIIAMSGDRDLLEMGFTAQIREIVGIHKFLEYNEVFDYCVEQGLDDLALFVYKRRGWVSAYLLGFYHRHHSQVSTTRHRELISAIAGRSV